MNPYSNAIDSYQSIGLHSKIENASAHQLIDMMLEGALSRLAKTKGYIQQDMRQQKSEEISKTLAIVSELNNCLNPAVTSDITDNLSSLYVYTIELITQANARNNLEKLEEASQILSHIRESWSLIPENEQY